MPVYAMLGLELEVMGWGTAPEDVVPFLPPGAKFEALEGVGHFMHIEQPDLIANKILKFIEETSRD
jgi:pimeloyl-ACP methyl ester carboxylesterase